MNVLEWTSRVAVHLVAVLFCIFIVLPIMLIVGDRSSPYINLQGEVKTDPAIPGGQVLVRFSGDYKRNCNGQVFFSIIDSGKNVHLLEALATIPDNSPSDLDKTTGKIEWTREFTLPLGTAEGPAIFRARPEYWCNPLQHYWPIKVDPQDFPFNVERPRTLPLELGPQIPGPPLLRK